MKSYLSTAVLLVLREGLRQCAALQDYIWSSILFGDIIGLYWGYMGIMENKMETIGIIGLYCNLLVL